MKKTLLFITLLCAFAQGAWAQNEWAVVYTQTQTTSGNWTAINAGSTTGQTLGSAGNTSYYYVNSNLSFTNSTAGGSGLTILGTVYLYVPQGVTVTCTGANAGGQTGAGAGIELAAGNSLYLIGGGTVNATGGNAANGCNGGNGGNGGFLEDEWLYGGAGGAGGHGGGGAGAGIGTRGGNGGNGGAVQPAATYTTFSDHQGYNGFPATNGATADAMGCIYLYQATGITVTATGGAAGTAAGLRGGKGLNALDDEGTAQDVYSIAGGAGGGAGGFGGAASDIGTGGPGGGGGGGGASGSIGDCSSHNFYQAGAYGGLGGQNADGTYAPNGEDNIMDNLSSNLGQTNVSSGNLSGYDNQGWPYGDAGTWCGSRGYYGTHGNATTSGSTSTVTVDWTTQEDDWGLICFQTGTTRADWVHIADNGTMGKTLGAVGTTTYYYTAADRTFTNSNAGGSGLTILGTVYLYIPSGKQITCTGANATAPTGGGAGIELTAGNTLYLIGSGSLVATGGNAANGGDGGNGGDASFALNSWVRSGAGGNGGNGGGGAGAGIGTRGANGGAGGAGGASNQEDVHGDEPTGNVGGDGANGGTAAQMGTLYIYEGSQALTPQTNIHGGSGGHNRLNGGSGGRHALYMYSAFFPYTHSIGGGGGGGGGGFGGAASDIGTGGPGGGGGGGGASGSIKWYSGDHFYQVGALGGHPSTNVNGTIAQAGESTLMTSDDANLLALKEPKNHSFENEGWEDGVDNRAAGGNGGGCGSASTSGSAISLVLWPTSGAGTAENPYLISSAEEWKTFAANVSSGNSYSGQYIKLANDISVTKSAGNYVNDESYTPFSGTFDGDGHTLTINLSNQSRFAAPFKCVSGATIKNLRTAGTIDGTGNADGKLLAGLVGVSFGNNTISGCVSSVTLTTDFGEDAAMAGFVAGTKGGSITISGCVFDGSMTGSSNTRCAGIAGYEYTATTTAISNCLFAPATLTVSTTDDGDTKTFSRDPDATFPNCYYTQTLGTAQGTASYFTTASAPSGLGNLVTDYGMVKAYDNGLFFNGKYYAAPGSGAGSQGTPYIIDSKETLAQIATLTNSGASDFLYTHFSLICDLDLSGQNWTPIGTTDRPFRGNFNGNNHIISNMTVNNPSGNYNGLFGWVEGSIYYPVDPTDPGSDYIKNFVVKNANVHGNFYTGGVAGRVHGQLTFENVILDGATVHGENYTGGFIGRAEGDYQQELYVSLYSTLNVNDCLFINGSVTANNNFGSYCNPPQTSHVMFGFKYWYYTRINNCYFNDVTYNSAAAPEDAYNVKAYPITPDVPSGVSCDIYNTTGISYDGSHYAPNNTTAHFTVAYNDFLHVITGVSVNGSQVGTSAGDYDFTIDGSQAQAYTITVTFRSGDSEEDPYLITNVDDWNSFVTHVSNGNTFSGKFLKLNTDIEVSTMVGIDDANSFQGTFDGDDNTLTVNYNTSSESTAPFRFARNAVIKNLHVDGTITTSAKFAGGIVGRSSGTLNITNCRSSVAINSSVGGDGTHGGIVARLAGDGNDIMIEGCIFDGSFATTANTNNCGGFIGWPVTDTPTIKNSLMIPSSVAAGMLNNTFTRVNYEPDIDNCFFFATSNLPTDQGAPTVIDAEILPIGDPVTYNTSGITAYTNGISYGGNFYYNPDRNIKREITGYGDEDGKWAFIASPVEGSIAPTAVNNLVGDIIPETNPVQYNYDLFRLNPGENQWENYVQHTGDFNIVNGNGYLYATQTTKNLVFSGIFNTENSKTVALSEGFNLVGNPFGVDAYVSKPFYQMNAEGTDIEPIINDFNDYTPVTIPPCTGIVVRATGADEVTFSVSAPQQQNANNNGNLHMTLTKAGVRNDAFQDKAIVSFNQGSQLEKFVFNERHAKLYIPQYGEDYAIAFSDMSGEVPLNFKATETGRYTIGFNFENVKGVRIQLIDKIEDKIIDLNKDVSGNVSTYTFMGSTIDRSDRFTLVFTQVETDGIFAYQSGNDIIVSGNGELQVFDVMGRMVMTQYINGVQTVEKPSTTGVYIFRLNGMSQKIVVK